jgi:hypothetical protein
MKYEIRVNTKFLQEYHRLKEQQEQIYSASGLQSYFEYVRDHADMFDREYYKEQLKMKGFVFPEDFKEDVECESTNLEDDSHIDDYEGDMVYMPYGTYSYEDDSLYREENF